MTQVEVDVGISSIANDRQRLSSTLRSLERIGEALFAFDDLNETLASVVSASVPELFGAMRIEARPINSRPEVVVAGGGIDEADAVTIALEAGLEVFGVLKVSGSAGRRLDEIDREVAADVAKRITLAVYSARALARERRVADTLQRALLPESLPQGVRVRASAAYLPGTSDAIVGGDWYDAFDLPDGRMAFSVGDVMGHGLRAAVVMGEVRQAFRAAAVDPKSPSLVLERANTIVNMRTDAAIVTAIFGILDRETSTVTYAVAGHPPPILGASDGTACTLPACGIPLGVADSVFTYDWTFTLAPGSLFALYTDGLTEHSRDVVLGEEQLLGAVRTQMLLPGTNPARDIVDRVFGGRKNADDVAALVLAVEDDVQECFLFDFSALPLAVPILRRAFASFLENRYVGEEDVSAALLAVGEAAANAVEHAYPGEPGLVRVRAEWVADELIIDVHDAGHWKPIERREERGRGFKIMRTLMDHIEIRTLQSETNVRLTLHVHFRDQNEGTA